MPLTIPPRAALRITELIGFMLIAGGTAIATELPRRDPAQLASTICATCHGNNLTGGAGPNLLDAYWNHGGSNDAIARSIRDGWWVSRMPPFKDVLSEAEIESLVAYIHQQGEEFAAGRITLPAAAADRIIQSERHTFRVETLVDTLEIPWGIAFLPDDKMLVTERPGRLRLIDHGKLQAAPIRGIPKAFFRQDGGLLDVIVHPDYAKNGWVYLAYSEEGAAPETSMTVVVRGRIHDGEWIDQQDIFRASPNLYYEGYVHYGSRFLFDREGHLFFTLGDRGHSNEAQDLTSPLGKIHRVMDDGRIPSDNPFVDRRGALGSIWSFGHRHPQGLMWHPVTGKLWETEHGPDGGDELNRIEPGRNYGWPVISDGTDRRIRIKGRAQEGMDRPITSWTPSIAPSGMEFYTGDCFPGWKNHLFVASLLTERLLRLEIDAEKVMHEETILSDMGRVRDVTTGPDGFLYVALEGPGRIVRLVPVDEASVAK